MPGRRSGRSYKLKSTLAGYGGWRRQEVGKSLPLSFVAVHTLLFVNYWLYSNRLRL